MARKQTRRTVSLPRPLYDAALLVAHAQGIPLAQFVVEAIRKAGVKAPDSLHLGIEHVKAVYAAKRLIAAGKQP
jgi:hypothetical protein